MLERIRAWLRPSTNNEFLSDLLHTKQGQEEMLGVAAINLPSASQVVIDVNRVLAYSNSADYKVWAQEVWSTVLNDLDKLLKPEATQSEINFYRGALSRTLALLRISHQARLRKPALEKQAAIRR